MLIHFDDYFSSGIRKINTWYRSLFFHGKEFSNIEDWCRNNVDVLIKTLSGQYHSVKISVGKPGFILSGQREETAAQDPDGSEMVADAISANCTGIPKWKIKCHINFASFISVLYRAVTVMVIGKPRQWEGICWARGALSPGKLWRLLEKQSQPSIHKYDTLGDGAHQFREACQSHVAVKE